MPLLYIAKVNLNSKIFDVYDENLSLDTVSNVIYENINDGDSIQKKETLKQFKDKSGNNVSYKQISEYSFHEIKKKKHQIIL